MGHKVTVRIKTDDTTIKKDFLEYNVYTMSHDDPILKKMVDQTIAEYKGELIDPEVTITPKFVWLNLNDKIEKTET